MGGGFFITSVPALQIRPENVGAQDDSLVFLCGGN